MPKTGNSHTQYMVSFKQVHVRALAKIPYPCNILASTRSAETAPALTGLNA